MSKKVITAALAGIMSAGMVTPVLATEGQNLDALNKAAYDATMKAEKEKTQGSVNAARAAIKALLQAKPDSEYIISLVGTYSQIVDGVQQPILSAAVTSVKKMNAEGTQANINEAYTNLPEELKEIDGTTVKEYWRNYHAGLKAQIDDAQSALQVKTSDAVKKAQAEKTPEAIKAAQDLVTEVSTSVKPAIVEWAKIMQDRLDAIEIYTLKVTEVVRINKTTIDVKFDELAEELKDVTLTVKDSNGKVYEVNTRDYVEKGATEASFTFKKALENDPTGTWTVNGVGYDATAQKFVDDVVAATTQQKLADTLSAYKGVTNYNVNNVSFYLSALNTNRDKIQTVSDVQKLVIDAGNTDAEKQDKVSYIKSSPNNVVLGQRMIESGIQRVNKEWLDTYNEGQIITLITSQVQTFSDIQARVDSVNKDKIDTLLKNDILDKTIENQKVTDAISLVEDFYPTDSTENENAKKTALGKLQIQKSIVAVVDATTPESVISALKKLAADDKTFAYGDFVNENLGKEYVEHINKVQVDAATVNTTEKIKNEIVKANTKATEKAIEDLNLLLNGDKDKAGLKAKYVVVPGNEDKTEAKQKERFAKDTKAQADMEAAFTTLAKASAKQEDKFDIAIVNKTSYYEYLKALGNQNTVPTISAAIKEVNNSSIETLFSDVDDKNLMEKLNNAVSNYGLENVIAGNKAVYVTNLADFKAPFGDKQLEDLQKRVNKLNALAVIDNAKSTEADVIKALTDYRNILEKENNNLIPGTVTEGEIADVAGLIRNGLIDGEATSKTLDGLNKTITAKLSKQKEIIRNINDVLSEALEKEDNSITKTSAVATIVKTTSPEVNVDNSNNTIDLSGFNGVTFEGIDSSNLSAVPVKEGDTFVGKKTINNTDRIVTISIVKDEQGDLIAEARKVETTTENTNANTVNKDSEGKYTVDLDSYVSVSGVKWKDIEESSKFEVKSGKQEIKGSIGAGTEVTLVLNTVISDNTGVDYSNIRTALLPVIDDATIGTAQRVFANFKKANTNADGSINGNGNARPVIAYREFAQVRALDK